MPVESNAIGRAIEVANAETLKRILSSDPVLVDCIPATAAVPNLEDGTILHSGPPISWDRMCGPMRGAVTGIAVFEGWARDLEGCRAQGCVGRVQVRAEPSL